MNFKPAQLENSLKNIGIDIKCIVLFGSNEGAIADMQKKCVEAVCGSMDDAFNCAQMEMEDVSKDGREVYSEFYAQSLMGGRRAVVVKNVTDALTAALKNMIPETSSENVLILSSASLNTRSSLITWAKDREDVIICAFYEDRESDLGSTTQNMLHEKGLNIDVPTLQFLCSRLSPDRKLNRGEIDKLVTYMGERTTVTAADVRAAVSDVAGANVEDLCYFTAGGEVKKACDIYNRLIKEGNEPATIVRQLSYHFSKLLDCAAQLEDGKNIEDAMKSIRPALMFYRKTAFMRQLQIWNKHRLLRIMKALYETERDCKTTNTPAEQCAGYFVLRLADTARQLMQKRQVI